MNSPIVKISYRGEQSVSVQHTRKAPPRATPGHVETSSATESGASGGRRRLRTRSTHDSTHRVSGVVRHVPAGYHTVDAVDARELEPGATLYTQHPSAGQDADGRWGLAAVRVEAVRPVGEVEGVEVCVLDVSIPHWDGSDRRITLAYAPDDLLRLKPRRGAVGS